MVRGKRRGGGGVKKKGVGKGVGGRREGKGKKKGEREMA